MSKITLTIPLRITIDIGDIVEETHVTAPDTESLEALESVPGLERAQPYYDEEADARAITEYYHEIDASAGPQALYGALNKLVTRSHKKKLNYKPATHLYPWVDVHEDGNILSIYSQKSFTPEELIQLDEAAENARLEALESMMALESFSTADLPGQLEALEANFPFNCEHVVPQSWFNKKEPMRGDLHHLFACEVKCNSFRGNLPFTEFAFEKVMQDCGEAIDGKFEPLGGRAEVARATLYFLLRYPGEINNKPKEYTRDALHTLLAWAQEPVSLYEQHRNQTIFAKQGNRNPLIDHPEWLERIDFTRGLGA